MRSRWSQRLTASDALRVGLLLASTFALLGGSSAQPTLQVRAELPIVKPAHHPQVHCEQSTPVPEQGELAEFEENDNPEPTGGTIGHYDLGYCDVLATHAPSSTLLPAPVRLRPIHNPRAPPVA